MGGFLRKKTRIIIFFLIFFSDEQRLERELMVIFLNQQTGMTSYQLAQGTPAIKSQIN